MLASSGTCAGSSDACMWARPTVTELRAIMGLTSGPRILLCRRTCQDHLADDGDGDDKNGISGQISYQNCHCRAIVLPRLTDLVIGRLGTH